LLSSATARKISNQKADKISQTRGAFRVKNLDYVHHCILVNAPLCGDQKARVASVQSFTLWRQATIEITRHAHSIICCSRHVYTGVVLHAHPVCGESHIQRNAKQEVEILAARLGWTCGND